MSAWRAVEQFIPFIKPLFDGLRSARDLFRRDRREKPEQSIEIPTVPHVTSFVKDLELLIDIQHGKPLIIRGTVAITVDRLRVFVDYSLFFTPKWQPRRRGPIGELKDPFRGQLFEMQLIYAHKREAVSDRLNLWWGDPAASYAGLPPANTDVGVWLH